MKQANGEMVLMGNGGLVPYWSDKHKMVSNCAREGQAENRRSLD